MDRQTAGTYGWIIIVTLVMAVLMAFATPLAGYVGEGMSLILDSYGYRNKQIVSEENMEELEVEWQDFIDDATQSLNHDTMIPEGGRYVGAQGTVLTAGQKFPIPVTGDTYYYKHIVYRYGYSMYPDFSFRDDTSGWGIGADVDYSERYTEDAANIMKNAVVLKTVAGQPITSASYAFYGFTLATKFPKLPDTVEDLTYTYSYCESLTDAPYTPNGVKYMEGAFYNSGIAEAPRIPNAVTSLSSTFAYCINLVDAPQLHEGITDLYYTFHDCSSLVFAPKIPSTVTNMSYTFYNCQKLLEAPVLPKGVTNMSGTFYGCSTIEIAPEIPSGVTTLSSTFAYCTKLSSAPTIHENITSLYYTFSGCTSLVDAPKIPSKVTNMYYTFNGCTNLSGTLFIDANPTTWTRALYNTNITAVAGYTTKAQNLINTIKSTATNP